MPQPLRVLIVEDNPSDAELVVRELRRAGFEPEWRRVDTEPDYLANLNGAFDIILSDYRMPTFDGTRALELLKQRELDIPFIIVSGTIGEDAAVQAMRMGAADYLLKDRIARLGQAVRNALEAKKLREEKWLAQEALLRSEELFRRLSESSPLGILLMDGPGNCTYINPRGRMILGVTATEGLNLGWVRLTPPEERDALLGDLHNASREGRECSREFRILIPEKPVRWVRLRSSLTWPENGKAAGHVATIEDITERKRLEEQFIEAQKMEVVGQLAGGVAHDFNNMLSVIMVYGEEIMHKLPAKDPTRQLVEQIRHAADRSVGLTRQLLAFSRKQTLQLMILDLNETVAGMDEMLRRLIDENVELAVLPGKRIGRVKADPGYVGQVLMNLVVNARDAMPGGGQITVVTGNVTLTEDYVSTHAGVAPGEYVMLAVTDTGVGMTEEVKAHLFEAFFTTKPTGKGTGLGLATCQTIVRQCGGHIGVYSELGKGTTFKVYFPCVDQPLSVSAQPTVKSVLPRGTEMLLVVEDEPALRHLAARVLEAQGYTVLRASNGQDGLRVAREHNEPPIRLVVTDIIMPQMDGKVMADWLTSTYPGLKILFTSGYTDQAIAHQGVLKPGVALLPKPYTRETLVRKVREMLDAAPESAHS